MTTAPQPPGQNGGEREGRRMKLHEFFAKKNIEESAKMLTVLYVENRISKKQLAELMIQCGKINAETSGTK